jgi:hypothetical protein
MPQRSTSLARQLSFEDMGPISKPLDLLARAGIEQRGAIFTRREVVDFILDLAGYTANRPLHKMRLLEPSFGEGDFLLPAIDRLLAVVKRTRLDAAKRIDALADSLCGVELHATTFQKTKAQVIARLREEGFSTAQSQKLADAWLRRGDFLLQDFAAAFDFIVGNPPYVRQELIPDALMAEYRARFSTIYDRADLYVPFIEYALRLLAPGGQLGFICADRWMKNKYGGPLRRLVADSFRLKIYVDMVDTPAFHSEVIAYPAVTIIARERGATTRVARRPVIEAAALARLAKQLTLKKTPPASATVRELAGVATDSAPWILDSLDQLAVVRRLEAAFPVLEDAGCKVGIGVATGADKAFIGRFEELDVETERKLPLVMTRDILEGHVQWRGLGVVNPFKDDGGLVALQQYPKLRHYLEERRDQIAKRHVAEKSPANWYRTIDRIYPALALKPKLLIPDIKGEAHIVYERGRLYPHHNLYFITSEEWNLKALQAVLRSGIARLFVSVYSTRMRGGYLRFQAQYLRRIRLPRWQDVPNSIKTELVQAAERANHGACNEAAFKLYGLSAMERTAIAGNGD